VTEKDQRFSGISRDEPAMQRRPILGGKEDLLERQIECGRGGDELLRGKIKKRMFHGALRSAGENSHGGKQKKKNRVLHALQYTRGSCFADV
jgi:hypothetical protein